jgi:hypothetical protein
MLHALPLLWPHLLRQPQGCKRVKEDQCNIKHVESNTIITQACGIMDMVIITLEGLLSYKTRLWWSIIHAQQSIIIPWGGWILPFSETRKTIDPMDTSQIET